MTLLTAFDNSSSSDIPYDYIFEDYLSPGLDPEFALITESASEISRPVSNNLNKKTSTSTITTKLIDSATKSFPTKMSTENMDIEIPMRSPARLMGKKSGNVNIVPNSPDVSILDTSSLDYNSSYGSDRSSQASIFSDISDRGHFDHDSGKHHDEIDEIDKPISLDDSDYEEILELLDYINIDEHEAVKQIDSVVTIKAHHNPSSSTQPLRKVQVGTVSTK